MSRRPRSDGRNTLRIDPTPKFDLSPYLYMQFMEPLGSTDGSVEASWNHLENRWRRDLIEVTRELGPTMMRWGGCFASYYRWQEGVGPRNKRVPMHNLLWGGLETNQVGTHEFVDFCRQVSAEPLLVVNMESDGRKHWARPGHRHWVHSGRALNRSGNAAEAAAWVDYCNNPRNAERRRNAAALQDGAAKPLNVRFWQIGNETSYDKKGFDCETAARKTAQFARAMRRADPSIQLIAWGDSGWAPRMIEVAGEQINYIAFHNGYRSQLPDSPLNHDDYRKDWANTWRHLMSAVDGAAAKLAEMRQQTDGLGVPLALTESHFSMPGPNRCNLMSAWACGVAYACIFNLYQRNGDALKIATLADFAGTRWMCNAVILPTPGEKGAHMLPVARVMSLFRHHTGRKAVTVSKAPADLDVAASRTGSRVWLHVANRNRTRDVHTHIAVEGMKIVRGEVFEITVDPTLEVWWRNYQTFAPVQKKLPASGRWTFPAASVTAVELSCAQT